MESQPAELQPGTSFIDEQCKFLKFHSFMFECCQIIHVTVEYKRFANWIKVIFMSIKMGFKNLVLDCDFAIMARAEIVVTIIIKAVS